MGFLGGVACFLSCSCIHSKGLLLLNNSDGMCDRKHFTPLIGVGGEGGLGVKNCIIVGCALAMSICGVDVVGCSGSKSDSLSC